MPQPGRAKPDPHRRLIEVLDAREHSLRERIAERRAALESAAAAPDPAGDAGDIAFDHTRAEVEHDLIERSLRELGQIAAVRSRIAAGSYGECLDCMEPIDPARLEINPLARRCTACQEIFERRGGSYGRPWRERCA